MADASDICDVLVGLISGYLYPSGTSQPSVIAGTAGIRVYDGWPVPDQLDLDLAKMAGTTPTPICHVSVWPLPGERNTTRYLPQWQIAVVNTPTLTLTIGTAETGLILETQGGALLETQSGLYFETQ